MTESTSSAEPSLIVGNGRQHANCTSHEDRRAVLVEMPNGQTIGGEVCDVSPGGIGILVDFAEEIVSDAQVTIDYQGNRLQGTLVSVRERDDFQMQVGVAWNASVLAMMEERRTDGRTEPDEDSRNAILWLSLEESISAAIRDIGPGGIGISVNQRLHLEIGSQIRLEYQGLRLSAVVANAQELNGSFRVGLRWEQPAGLPLPSDLGSELTQRTARQTEVVVGIHTRELLYLEQVDVDTGDKRILATRAQLKAIMKFLAAPDSQRFHVSGRLTGDISVRLFPSDKSFSITQSNVTLFGIGDVRQAIRTHDSTPQNKGV